MHALLSVLVWLPITAGIAVLLLGERNIVIGRWLALAASLATLALAVPFTITPSISTWSPPFQKPMPMRRASGTRIRSLNQSK